KQIAGSPGKVPAAVVAELKQHTGASLVIAGEHQSPAVHALAHAVNHALGNIGNTVIYTEPLERNPAEQVESLRELIRDMDSGAVEMVMILVANLVYTSPADLPFA